MTRRGWVLFWAMAFIWGVPYFFIRVAVEELEPAVVVFGRTSLAAVVLLYLANRADGLRPALAHWRPIAAFAVLEMAIPWILLTTAEQHIASGLAALIISSVPIFGALAAFALGDRGALRPIRLAGIALGIGGVTLLVGNDLSGEGAPPWWSVAFVIVVCVCYATAPFIITRRLADVPVARRDRPLAQHRDRDLPPDRRCLPAVGDAVVRRHGVGDRPRPRLHRLSPSSCSSG